MKGFSTKCDSNSSSSASISYETLSFYSVNLSFSGFAYCFCYDFSFASLLTIGILFTLGMSILSAIKWSVPYISSSSSLSDPESSLSNE